MLTVRAHTHKHTHTHTHAHTRTHAHTHTHTHAAPLPESQVATQLLDSIKAKETTDKMATVLDSLASLDPELGQNRDGEKRMGGGGGDVLPSLIPRPLEL